MPRRCLAEFIGTFGIVFAPVALSATGSFPAATGVFLPLRLCRAYRCWR
jgi:hypothetical protein